MRTSLALGTAFVYTGNNSDLPWECAMRASLLCASIWFASWAVAAEPAKADRVGVEYYEQHIRPLFIEPCYECHSATAKKLKGGLRLDSKDAWQKGDSGPMLVPGEPEKSILIHAVRRKHQDVSPMPPDKALNEQQVQALVEWVKRGAPAPNDGVAVATPSIDIAAAQARWPYTPLPATVPVPAVKQKAWPKNDIDRFILAKLEEKQLVPMGDTDKRSLIRRATFDLLGLPPTPAEVDAFLRDSSPNAFATVIDRLLASSHYGERWGRHWLDVVRYADTAGDNSDYPIPQMYLYRNWVIDAINRDLPYDQFIREQLAGDLLGGATEDERQQRLIATGYIANARRFGSRVDDYPTHLTIEDTLDNLGRAFMGLTMNCARCHDHKFDPLTMQDYYGLYGIFNSTRYPWPGIELDKRQRDFVPLVPLAEADKLLAERRDEEARLTTNIKQLEQAKKAEKEKPKQDELAKQIAKLVSERQKLQQRPMPFPTAYAVAEGKTIGNVALQFKGDPTKPGNVVPRGFPTIFGGATLPKDDRSSGRLALANWIADAKNPLTARVLVNRVWQYHFGRGIVATPNDFGRQGQAPTHPELLDHLAKTFIASGWSLKKLHREVMLSRTYQLASTGEQADAVKDVDVNNTLLWKYRRLRLDAESIRDALLAVSGQLDRTPGAIHPFPPPHTWDFTQHKPFRAVYENQRRSVYLMTQRIQRHPYLAIFDGPDTGASTATRVTSTTTLQALYLLNDQFVHEQAAHLVKRLPPGTAEPRIIALYALLFSRPPTREEVIRGQEFLHRASDLAPPASNRETFAWESYTRTLVRLNEFVYLP